MASDTFYQFSLLPFELRCMIYLFASPPRFVHVQEHHEDCEAFGERFGTSVVQVKLHPSIAYFAHNWRDRIPWPPRPWREYYRHHQLTLDMFGFDCPRPKHQPWESTEEVPAIPHHFLSENPEVAWEFLRTGSFYSTAPIPTLLHVTRESRQFLIDQGYELAFRTRTCGPRVWFNFKTDILYIGRYYDEWPSFSVKSLLSGNGSWDIGQFDPLDFKKVRRLALQSSGDVASPSRVGGVEEISGVLELFTDVEELFLEEHGLCDEISGRAWRSKQLNGRSLWSYTPVVEVDILSSLLGHQISAYSTGPDHGDLRAYKEDNMGDGTRYFVDLAHKFERKLTSRRDELLSHKLRTWWRIPKVNIVYIGHQSMCETIFKLRWISWNRFQVAKEAQSRSNAAEEAQRSIDVPKRPLYHRNEDSPPSPFTERFQDDMEALQQIMDYETQDYSYSDYAERSFYRDWVLNGTVAAPEM
ncbi:hypothetical protein F4860DRAFT_493926 [Xylaria cubensis]|nr:hypothetical protein F4860DRAFT_493926 [Xylaria cubensis]